MKVEDIITLKKGTVVTVRPTDTVKQAADRLRLANIAALVVVQGNAIHGLITEREIARGLSHYGEKLLAMEVKDLMTEAIICAPEDNTKSIMKLMTQHRTRHIPVVSEGRLRGIISIGDIVKHRLRDLELETGVMRDVYFASH